MSTKFLFSANVFYPFPTLPETSLPAQGDGAVHSSRRREDPNRKHSRGMATAVLQGPETVSCPPPKSTHGLFSRGVRFVLPYSHPTPEKNLNSSSQVGPWLAGNWERAENLTVQYAGSFEKSALAQLFPARGLPARLLGVIPRPETSQDSGSVWNLGSHGGGEEGVWPEALGRGVENLNTLSTAFQLIPGISVTGLTTSCCLWH